MLHEILEFLEPFIAIMVALLSIATVLTARLALRRGLTHYAIKASAISVVIICAVFIWNFFSELLSISETTEAVMEMFEYAGYAFAYGIFIFLSLKHRKLMGMEKLKS